MPKYDYKCKNCGYKFEVTQSINDEKLSKCPKCEGELKRLIGTGVSLSFKGHGFYCTDYK